MGHIYYALIMFIKLMLASTLVSGLIGLSINPNAYIASGITLTIALVAGVIVIMLAKLNGIQRPE